MAAGLYYFTNTYLTLNMLIQHKLVGHKGMFYVGQDGAILAELVYTKPSEDKMIIEHTEVDDSLGGKGVGLQLVHTAVEYARTHHLKVIPLCPFAKAIFDKKAEYRDVLA
ncbi:MAG: GNAT family N-acetyltransferase [Chitinophagaceae bacterium]